MEDRSYLLATGFGTTAAMWGVGYVGRLPSVVAPSELVLTLMVGCLLGGGILAGRLARSGFRAGAATGALASVLNLLVLGSLLGGSRPNEIVPSALWWLPGSILAGIAFGSVGGAIGARLAPPSGEPPDATAAFAKVAAATTLLLLVVGGVVTSKDAGLAVVDWPRTYGYNMFLYPLSRMTGGIYYEHAHRLFGSLVGLTTVVLAVHLQLVESRRWVKRLGLLAVLLVVVQGILGGLRVTEPNIYLAVAHGVLAQVFFSVLVSVAVFTSRAWKRAQASPSESALTDRSLAWILVGILFVQLGLGAALRHLDAALYVHGALGTALLPCAVVCGSRSLDRAPLRHAGWSLIALTTLQVMLGLATLVATRLVEQGPVPGSSSVLLATAHQATGALVLASALALALWSHRLRTPLPARAVSMRASA